MKSLNVLFTAIVFVQCFLTLNLKAEETPAVEIDDIYACEKCR